MSNIKKEKKSLILPQKQNFKSTQKLSVGLDTDKKAEIEQWTASC